MTSVLANPKPAARPSWQKAPRTLASRALRPLLLLATGIGLGAVAAHFVPRGDRSAKIAEALGTALKPGPWGELYAVPFSIAAPDELLPVRAIEAGGTHWVFKNTTPSEVGRAAPPCGFWKKCRELSGTRYFPLA